MSETSQANDPELEATDIAVVELRGVLATIRGQLNEIEEPERESPDRLLERIEAIEQDVEARLKDLGETTADITPPDPWGPQPEWFEDPDSKDIYCDIGPWRATITRELVLKLEGPLCPTETPTFDLLLDAQQTALREIAVCARDLRDLQEYLP